jgi:hypothetical protein
MSNYLVTRHASERVRDSNGGRCGVPLSSVDGFVLILLVTRFSARDSYREAHSLKTTNHTVIMQTFSH